MSSILDQTCSAVACATSSLLYMPINEGSCEDRLVRSRRQFVACAAVNIPTTAVTTRGADDIKISRNGNGLSFREGHQDAFKERGR